MRPQDIQGLLSLTLSPCFRLALACWQRVVRSALLRQFFLPLFGLLGPFCLEVISPGGLHNSMKVEKMIASRRYTRNNILVGIMRGYEHMDHRGMGIRSKALLLLKAHKHPESLFEATEDYLNTNLYRKKN